MKVLKKWFHRPTSKKVVYLVFIFAAYSAIVSTVATFVLHDSAPIIEVMRGASILTPAAVGFYLKKSERENLHKYDAGVDGTPDFSAKEDI